VPAGLTASGGAVVHHIVGDDEEALELQVQYILEILGTPLYTRFLPFPHTSPDTERVLCSRASDPGREPDSYT